jgi:hypothetical protein
MIDLIRLGFELIGVIAVGSLLLAWGLQWRDRVAAEKAEGAGK